MLDVEALETFAAIAAPTGAEEERLRWLERRLNGAPGTRERDAAGNLIWRGSEGGTPKALVMAHVDTVFAADTALTIERDGHELVGPGVGDNAAAVIALVSLLERLPELPRGIAVAFTVGEEGLGNLRGAIHACSRLRPGVAVAVEGHGLDHVIIEHVGSLRARLSVTGPGGHSWWDRGTPSAIHALVSIASALAGSGANVGRISGGGPVNAIASLAEMLVERRSLEESDLAAFDERLAGLSVAAPLALEREVVGRRPAGRLDTAHPLVQTVMAARRELGLPQDCGSGSTDANAAAAADIPAVAIGCGRGSGMHTVGERIDLASLELGCRQLESILGALSR
jgi:tripeptide aminopeptidase